MQILSISALVAGARALAACGSNEPQGGQEGSAQPANSAAASADPSGETHSGTGKLTEVSGVKVTIAHGPVASVGWPAMTMSFQASSPDLLKDVKVGDTVDFQFQKAGEQYALTSISKAQQ